MPPSWVDAKGYLAKQFYPDWYIYTIPKLRTVKLISGPSSGIVLTRKQTFN